MRNTLLISGLLMAALASAAGARDMTVQDTRQVLGEASAARDALAKGQKKVAADLVKHALSVDERLVRHHRTVLLDEGAGRERVDLVRAERALTRAKVALAAGKVTTAEQALANVSHAVAPLKVPVAHARASEFPLHGTR